MHHPSASTYRLLVLVTLLPLSMLRGERPIMTIAEARALLSRRESNEPVRVRGIITFSNQRLGLAYVQDSSGGIGFDPRTHAARLPEPGETVEIEGFLSSRQGMDMLLRHRSEFGPPKVTLVSEIKQKVKPLSFDLDHAAQMQIDGLVARVSGVVRRVSVPPMEGSPMLVEISSPSGYAIARLPWRESQEVLDRWLNSAVTLTAVLVGKVEPPMVPADAHALLLVSARSDWTMQYQGMEQVFQRPPVKAATAIQAAQRSTVKQRVHLVGTVTAAKPRSWLTLRTENGSIEVSTRQMAQFLPGQRLAIAGWPQNKDGRIMLQDGVCRTLGEETEPQPVRLEQGFFHPGMQRELVEVTGILNTHSLPGGTPRFTVSMPSGVNCLLAWEALLQPNELHDLMNGCRVRLVGIGHITNGNAENLEGTGLSILPRSMKDVMVLSPPTWWTSDRLMLAVWWLLGIVGIALPGALIFRWQIWRQARHIHEIESKAATEEERLRIAREFHDSLQQELTSAALHLETLKGAIHAAPEMLPRLIDDTTAMLRHCQIEARHCIWDLRSKSTVAASLKDSLDDWLHNRIRPGAKPQVQFTHEGLEPKLPEGVPFQLMRITQEAVTNALNHASATHIRVRLEFCSSQLELVIEDDGLGFEASLLSHPKPGHYGLSGLKERVSKIGARLELDTQPGVGTRVSVRLSLANIKHETCV